MTWILILSFTFQGQTSVYTAGIMATEQACIVAGAGSVPLLEAGTPGMTVAFACVRSVMPLTS